MDTTNRWWHGLLLALLALVFSTTPVAAHSSEELRDEIREVLIENPEIILDAIEEIRNRQQAAETAAANSWLAENRAAIFNDGFSVVGGNPDGDITLVEYFDYRCGFCRKVLGEVLAFLQSDGNVRLVLKEFPILGEASVVAARASIAASEQDTGERFFAYHRDLLEFGGSLNERAVLEIAERHGYDSARMREAMSSDKADDIIARNRQTARRLGISGTPAFVMGSETRAGYMGRAELAEWAAQVRDASSE